MKRAKKKDTTKLNEWLTTSQFGRLVGRTGKTIRIWIQEGYIPDSCVQKNNGQYRVQRLAQHCLGDD